LTHPDGPSVAAGVPALDENDAKFSAYTRERVEYWSGYARAYERWQRSRAYYQRRLAEIYTFLIPPGMRVLEVGCARGDLLAVLKPAYGMGIDFCPEMIEGACKSHPELNFVLADAHSFTLNETFDYIVCLDLVNDLWDVQQVFERIALHCHPGTRVILNAYSRLWELPRKMAEGAGIAGRQLRQNWLAPGDIDNLLYLGGLELIRTSQEILWPFRTPLVDALANQYLVKLAPFRWFALENVFIARPNPAPISPAPVVSVVVAARNEEGNIPAIFDRVPQMGAGTELIFVEGNSKDDTWGAIEREIARRPGVNARLFKQPGKGKGDAVRVGFREATGEVLMILDADMTVAPEDLPRFYQAWRSGRAEFVNGVRLVYPMEHDAMRFFNQIGNKFFSLAFTWLLSQSVKDTLCGTKVLSKSHYEMIAANRGYFGEIDPFGDFDLIFGAAKYNLAIVDLPIRYRERTYGETNIQRWSHGVLLLRMVLKAMRKIKFV
jgi:2-polyprenyl-3-methyl-5-hydroxy-6-metoxy-1,4-benzoquinol methylase